MLEKLKELKRKLFPAGADIQILAFNVLALSGIIVSLTVAVYSFSAGAGWDTIAYELAGVVFSIIMIWYTTKTGKYQIAMVITIFVVFIGIFSGIYISGGGYAGGAPEFFVFAIVFTAFLLDGFVAIIMIAIEIAWYSGICVYSYLHPEVVDHFSDEKDVVIDIIACFIIASLSLAATMYYQVRVYRKKQKELNSAREEADNANNAKSEFIAKISHDIRTPLNTAMAMNQLIMQNAESDEIVKWASDSEASCTLLLGMINDMLDISKIESGKLDIRVMDYSISEMLKNLNLEWKLVAESKGLDLFFEIDPEIPSSLTGGYDSLYKILSNLLSNAIKYTNTGFVKLSLNKCGETAEGIKLKYIIEDTGIGIPQEYLDTIFLPFERGNQSLLKGTDGSGLGLAIVKELSELMSASISCESELEVGSRFFLELNQGVADRTPVGNIDFETGIINTEIEEEDFVVSGARILIVDDNYFNRKVLRELLEPYMLQIDDVESGEEALEMIEIKEYDLVFMDYRMPYMNGEETLSAIKEEFPDWQVPVIVLTADAMAGTRERMLQAGFDDFLTKPVSLKQLKAVIIKFLDSKIKYFENDDRLQGIISKDKIKEYEEELNKYGMSIIQVLEKKRNDVSELLIRIDAFAQYYEALYDGLASERNDDEAWKMYILEVHSLKAAAKGIGAKALSDLSALIEYKNDRNFSENSRDLLLSELELVYEGIQKVYLKDSDIL